MAAKKIKSIIQTDTSECFCRDENCWGRLEVHHIFNGHARRKIADREGLVVVLCYQHHQGTNGVHGKNGEGLNAALQELAQEEWEANFIRNYPYKNHAKEAAREAWIRMMSKNYIYD